MLSLIIAAVTIAIVVYCSVTILSPSPLAFRR